MDLTKEWKDGLQERIQQGVKLLDTAKPRWWEEIDLELLDMSSCRSCILGQLYREYVLGVDALTEVLQDYTEGPVYFQGADHGLDLCGYLTGDEEERQEARIQHEGDNIESRIDLRDFWDSMGELWADVIRERKEQECRT